MVRTWGYRGVRVGEASHPGPRLLRRYPRDTGVAPTIVDSDEELLLHARHTVAVSQPTHGLAVADSGTRHSARLQGVRGDHRRGLVVEVAPGVADATAVDLSDDVSDGDDDLADGEAVPAFNFMDSDEEDELDRTVAESRLIEDVPRPPPDEEFLDHFQQDLMRTRRIVRRRVQDSVSDAPEVGNRHPSRRVALVPGSEEGTPQSIQDRVPSTVPASGIEIPEDSRDSTFQSTVAVQGINPTLVDRSSQQEQSSHSLLGNRFCCID